MSEIPPCHTCAASSGIYRNYCDAFECQVNEAEAKYCPGHRYHMHMAVFRQMFADRMKRIDGQEASQ